MTPVTIPLADGGSVPGLLQAPPDPAAAVVLAHGAGAGMAHPFMAAAAEGLVARGLAVLRYQFPFMAEGRKPPDRPPVAQATVRGAVAAAAQAWPGLPLIAGGKSFGGRMTSGAQAVAPLPGVRALLFLGFPLHAAAKPGIARAAHLADVALPMLFVQGTRDALAEPGLLRPMVEALGPRATLLAIEGADHGFHVPARSGRTDADVLATALDAVEAWILPIVGAS